MKFNHKFVPEPVRYPSRFDSPEERLMRDQFIKQARHIVSEEDVYKAAGSANSCKLLAGLELEFPLVLPNLSLANQAARDSIIQFLSPAAAQNYVTYELGAHQLEIINPTAIDLKRDGFRGLQLDTEKRVSAVAAAASALGIRLLRIGSYPFGAIEDADYTKGSSEYAKYQRSPAWHNFHKRRDVDTTLRISESIDVSNAFVVTLFNSVQMTIDALDFDDAIDKLNRSWMISPLALALGANASYLALRHTGYADVRFVAWSLSHDSRSGDEVTRGMPTRVGLPRRYCEGLNDYFNRILSYPFVLVDQRSLSFPFQVGNGLYWRDARLKFFLDKKTIGVEFRPLPIQPSLDEDISLMAFYVGRLLWSTMTRERLLPIEDVIANKEQAMQHGVSCTLRYSENGIVKCDSGRTILEREIDRAEQGLREIIPDDSERKDCLGPMRDRLQTGSPAEQFCRHVQDFETQRGVSQFQETCRFDALSSAINAFHLISE